MKTSKIKICGITNIDGAVRLLSWGWYVGMIINVPFSPNIDKIMAVEISAAAKVRRLGGWRVCE